MDNLDGYKAAISRSLRSAYSRSTVLSSETDFLPAVTPCKINSALATTIYFLIVINLGIVYTVQPIEQYNLLVL